MTNRTDLDIDTWKGRHVSAVPRRHPGETVVIEDAHRRLVMTDNGNRLDRLDAAPAIVRRRLAAGEAEARVFACLACEHYQPGPDRCRLCGCGFIISERSLSSYARCPAGRWPA